MHCYKMVKAESLALSDEDGQLHVTFTAEEHCRVEVSFIDFSGWI